MNWVDRKAKLTVDNDSGQRFIKLEGEKNRLRILTEDGIGKMGDTSFSIYRQKIAAWNDRVHKGGTPEAVKAIDYLRHATDRSKRARHENQ